MMHCLRGRSFGLVVVAILACTQAAFAATPAPPAAPATVQTHVRGEFRFATGPAPAWVRVQAVADRWPADARGDLDSTRWRNWLLDSQLDRRGGRHVGYLDQAFQPLATELVASAAKYSIEFNPLYQQLTIHRAEVRRDGVWTSRLEPDRISLARREERFERDMADGNVTALVLLPDVRVGDVVRLAYSIEGSNPILAGNLHDSVRLGWIDPVLDRHVRALFDRDAKVDTKRFNTEVPVTLKPVGDHQELTVDARLVPASRDEGSYPGWFDRFPTVQFAPRRSWSDVVAWALPLYPEASLPAELESRLPQWQAIAAPEDRAFAILRTVQREVRYFGTEMGDNTHRPAPPAETWQRRYGDCKDKAYLVATLLRRVGIEAEPALVSVDDGKSLFGHLPSASAFDHVIVRARIGGTSYWLDPTLAEQRGDLRTLDVRGYGAALPVRAGETALVAVTAPASTHNSVTVDERYTPAADGTLDLEIRTVYTGLRAEGMRWRVNSEGLDEMSRSFADYYRKRYSDLDVAAPLTVDDAADADKLVISEHYLLKDGWSGKLGGVRQIELYAEALSSDAQLPASMQRKGPLGLQRPATLQHDITFLLPKGWSLVESPEAVDLDAGAIHYRRSASQSEGRFELKHRLDVVNDDVEPAKVPEFLRQLRLVREELGNRVSFKAAGDDADAARRERLRKLLRDTLDAKPAAEAKP
jgi:transglutaminase-like putative cysteine protease